MTRATPPLGMVGRPKANTYSLQAHKIWQLASAVPEIFKSVKV